VAKYTLQNIHDLAYRWGDCQAIEYSSTRPDVFPSHSGSYLLDLYERCRTSGRAKLGILEPLFCGMKDLSAEAIVAFLHVHKIVVLGEWRPTATHPRFHPLGFCFLTALCEGKTTRAGFGAYAFFSEAWRTDQQIVLTWLGIAHLFFEGKLCALHGTRYADNHLTARWMAKFGFKDAGTLENHMIRYSTGELTAATISTLVRADFEARLSAALELGEKPEEV